MALKHDQLLERDSTNDAECLATEAYVRGMTAFRLEQTAPGFRKSFAVFLSLLNSFTESASISMLSVRIEYLDATPTALRVRSAVAAS